MVRETRGKLLSNYAVFEILSLYPLTLSLVNKLQYLLQYINTELSGPGDDAALARFISAQDEVGWSKQLRLSQEFFGLLVADNERRLLFLEKKRQSRHMQRQPVHKSGTVCSNSTFKITA